MNSKSIFIGGGVNDHCACLCWGSKYLAYAVNWAIVLIPTSDFPASSKNRSILLGHQDEVTSLRWIKHSLKNEELLLSTSADGQLLVWQPNTNQDLPYVKLQPIENIYSLLSCDAIWLEEEQRSLCVAACASACDRLFLWDVIFYDNDDNQPNIISNILTIPHKSNETRASNLLGLILTVRISPLRKSHDDFLMALGTDSGAIHLYHRENNVSKNWHFTLSLSGHEDWVRSLDFYLITSKSLIEELSTCHLLLCSASQDKTVRIWRFVTPKEEDNNVNGKESESLVKMKPKCLGCECEQVKQVNVWVDAVLVGHDMWVFSGVWCNSNNDNLELLTASWDKTVCLWRPHLTEQGTHLWTEVARLGQVGGNGLGLYDAVFSPNGLCVVAHGYQGSLFLWSRTDLSSTEWNTNALTSGHFAPVECVCWAKSNQSDYFLSVSQDQTTRLYGCCQSEWREIARPQIHGYNMNSIASIAYTKFASAADEMVVRVFTAPRSFLATVDSLLGHTNNEAQVNDTGDGPLNLPQGAMVPALGLSNKAVYNEEELHGNKDADHLYVQPKIFDQQPPAEDDLSQNTLWPEEKKLYGHAYEVYSIAVHPNGSVLASAAKASQSQHASIFLWKINDWTLIQKLTFHKLTVVHMRFSYCGQFLLAVSRDRHWSLWKHGVFDCQSQLEQFHFELYSSSTTSPSKHSRIIWSCAWTPDNLHFITASRDKSIRMWSMATIAKETANVSSVGQDIQLHDAITALDCTWLNEQQESYLIAAGLECGSIHLIQWNCLDQKNHSLLCQLSLSQAHHQTVRSLHFHPNSMKIDKNVEEKKEIILASAGLDKLVRLYSFTLQ